jgi:hypothetical protein
MNPLTEWLALLQQSVEEGFFVKMTLGHPTGGPDAPLKLLFKPVTLRGRLCCSVVSRYERRDVTKNHDFPEMIQDVAQKLGTEFLSAHLVTQNEEAQLELGRKPRLKVIPRAHAPAALAHDRRPSRWVDSDAAYLKALEVTDARGRVRERMGDKFRQIERFVDLLASAWHECAGAGHGGPFTFCDMGCGKGYLTFAAHDYFTRVEKLPVEATGVETRPDLAGLCNRVAGECEMRGLRFEASTIAEFTIPQGLDCLIALHACNTATDDALFAGIAAGARMILTAPCCHKELRPQIDAARHSGPLADVLRHGLFAERHAEMATDALRTLLLEREGYRVRVGEFVSLEHTAKNVMLIATRRETPLPPAAIADLDERIARLKAFYGIQHQFLETLLLGRRELERPAAASGAVS